MYRVRMMYFLKRLMNIHSNPPMLWLCSYLFVCLERARRGSQEASGGQGEGRSITSRQLGKRTGEKMKQALGQRSGVKTISYVTQWRNVYSKLVM